jgi:hypothetical protein
MKHWLPRQIVALVLGVFLALGMSLSAIQASDMAVQMAMMSDAGASGQSGCDACGGNGDDRADAVTCSPMLNCFSMAAVLPVQRGLAATDNAELFVSTFGVARDLTAPPDPYPPKSLHIS